MDNWFLTRKKKEGQSAIFIRDQQAYDLLLYPQARIFFSTKISFALMQFSAVLHLLWTEVLKVPFYVWKWSLIDSNKLV